MSYVKLNKWHSDNGQTAVSFPTQAGFPGSTNILRSAKAAADHSSMVACFRYRQLLGRTPQGTMSDDDYRELIWEKEHRFRVTADRRYLKLFKAMGLK